jgi:cobalt-zinc-cadmium efflux system protein
MGDNQHKQLTTDNRRLTTDPRCVRFNAMGTPHNHSDHHPCTDGHAHDHPAPDHAAPKPGGKMGLAVAITLAFVGGEAFAGFFAHSLALLSDAGHNFADAAALAFSWYALWIARKPSHHRMTFGYHRVGILAALVNAASLVVIALFIFFGGIERLRHPQAVNSTLMIVVALAAIGVNVLIGFWLHAGAKHDINVRGAYLHMVGDAVSAFGVVLAGLVVAFTGASVADPVVSFLIAGLILWSSWGVLKESVNVLLEGTPLGIDMQKVEGAIRGVPRVLDCHDLHVWTVGPGAVACSVHVLVGEQTIREGQQILRLVCESLRQEFKINHTTVQIEVEGHCPDELYCCIQPDAHAHVGHHH